MYNLFIGDVIEVDEDELLHWLSVNVSPIASTSKQQWAYYTSYISKDNAWLLSTVDTSDVNSVGGCFDSVTHITFKSEDDALFCKLRWGGSLV